MSNPYPQRFLDLHWQNAIQSDYPHLSLDCGASNRKMNGVISLDIASCARTVQADALQLPFRDEAFDLVLSQAVIEHVKEPQTYVDEVFRVLRPGGLFLAEVAFMQPIHCAPHHYFNVTPYGMQHLCRRFETLEFELIGLFSETIAWLFRAAGLKTPRNVPEAKDYWHVASGTRFLGRKAA